MIIKSGNRLGKELCEALGINHNQVHGIEIICKAGDIAYANLIMYIPDEQGLLKETIAKYRLENKV